MRTECTNKCFRQFGCLGLNGSCPVARPNYADDKRASCPSLARANLILDYDRQFERTNLNQKVDVVAFTVNGSGIKVPHEKLKSPNRSIGRGPLVVARKQKGLSL